MGAKVTFDSENRLVVVTAAPVAGVVTLDVQVDLYSDMKEDIRSSATLAANPPAFLPSMGGVPTATGYTGSYYFLNNTDGWRILPYDADHELYLVGNFQVINPDLPWWVARPGRTVLISREFSNLAAGVAVGGGAVWTSSEKGQIRDALGVDGSKIAASGGQLQTLDGKADGLVADVAAVQVTVDSVEGKVDAQSAELAIMQARVLLIKKVAINKMDLLPGDTDNLIVYDDDDVTPLLIGSCTDCDGNPICPAAGIPANRSRLE